LTPPAQPFRPQEVIATLKPGSFSVQRFKGLGEMMPEQLWETTMNPATRNLTRLTVDDLVGAGETFAMLMGDDVAARKELIREHGAEIAERLVV